MAFPILKPITRCVTVDRLDKLSTAVNIAFRLSVACDTIRDQHNSEGQILVVCPIVGNLLYKNATTAYADMNRFVELGFAIRKWEKDHNLTWLKPFLWVMESGFYPMFSQDLVFVAAMEYIADDAIAVLKKHNADISKLLKHSSTVHTRMENIRGEMS